MTLMEGDWNCNVVGWNSIMTITQVSENGMFRGTLAPNGVFSEELVIYGSYNDASKSLRFLVKPNLAGNQLGDIGFVGFLFSSPASPEPGEDFRWIITGSCEVYELDTVRKLGGNSKRLSFGWTAEKLVRQ